MQVACAQVLLYVIALSLSLFWCAQLLYRVLLRGLLNALHRRIRVNVGELALVEWLGCPGGCAFHGRHDFT